MSISQILTALVVNKELKFYHSHTATEYKPKTPSNSSRVVSDEEESLLEKEEALANY